MSRAVFATVVLLAAVSAARAADRGYLAGHEVDFHTVLGPPPAEGSLWDQADGQLVQAYQSVDEARWRLAEKDAHEDDLYSRFAEAFGKPIDSRTSPVLVALLDRALRAGLDRAGPPAQRIRRSRSDAARPRLHAPSGGVGRFAWMKARRSSRSRGFQVIALAISQELARRVG